MKIYIDLIFLLNVYLDFLIILSTALLLKRKVVFKRFILGSLIGGFSTFLLFISLNNITLFLLKFLFSFVMVIISFSYRNFNYFINNLFYFYITSMVLGGGVYLFELNSIILLLIFSFFILFFYLKGLKKLKSNYNNYANIEVFYKNNKYNFIGYIDSGNKLVDQYKKRPINLIYSDLIDYNYEELIYVPYETASGSGILRCIKIDKIIIDKKEFFNNLIGFMDKEIKIDGIDVILNSCFINI